MLKNAIHNSHRVYSARGNNKLLGLINSLSDGVMTVYFHYLLVRPEYQNMGIGKELVKLMLEEYKDFAHKMVIVYDREFEFYKNAVLKLGRTKVQCLLLILKHKGGSQ